MAMKRITQMGCSIPSSKLAVVAVDADSRSTLPSRKRTAS